MQRTLENVFEGEKEHTHTPTQKRNLVLDDCTHVNEGCVICVEIRQSKGNGSLIWKAF